MGIFDKLVKWDTSNSVNWQDIVGYTSGDGLKRGVCICARDGFIGLVVD